MEHTAYSRPSFLHGQAELPQPEQRKRTQSDWEWLLCLDGSRHAATSQNEGCEESDLRTIRLTLTNAKASETVLRRLISCLVPCHEGC